MRQRRSAIREYKKLLDSAKREIDGLSIQSQPTFTQVFNLRKKIEGINKIHALYSEEVKFIITATEKALHAHSKKFSLHPSEESKTLCENLKNILNDAGKKNFSAVTLKTLKKTVDDILKTIESVKEGSNLETVLEEAGLFSDDLDNLQAEIKGCIITFSIAESTLAHIEDRIKAKIVDAERKAREAREENEEALQRRVEQSEMRRPIILNQCLERQRQILASQIDILKRIEAVITQYDRWAKYKPSFFLSESNVIITELKSSVDGIQNNINDNRTDDFDRKCKDIFHVMLRVKSDTQLAVFLRNAMLLNADNTPSTTFEKYQQEHDAERQLHSVNGESQPPPIAVISSAALFQSVPSSISLINIAEEFPDTLLKTYHPTLQAYIKIFDGKPKFSDQYAVIEASLKKDDAKELKNYICPISLEITNIPVRVFGKVYDLLSLKNLGKDDNNQFSDPQTRYQFSERDIQLDREASEKINVVLQKYEKHLRHGGSSVQNNSRCAVM